MIQPVFLISDKEIPIVVMPFIINQEVKDLYKCLRKNTIVIQQLLYDKNEYFLKNNLNHLIDINFPLDDIYLMCDLQEQVYLSKKLGYPHAILCNANISVHEHYFNIIEGIEKIYDAFMVARFMKYKRHYLAKFVKNLAICGRDRIYDESKRINVDDLKKEMINVTFWGINVIRKEIAVKYNQSFCSLCLSNREGACESSIESLLCGCPIITTKNSGGRDFWLNENNSIYCEDSAKSVAECVEEIKILKQSGKFDSKKIRLDTITKLNEQKKCFEKMIIDIGVKDENLLYRISNDPLFFTPLFKRIYDKNDEDNKRIFQSV